MKEPSSHLYKDFKLRALADFIKELIRGRTNAVGTVTLTNSSTTSTVTNVLVSPTSRVFLQAVDANAAGESPYISDISEGSFEITHASAGTTRVFYYKVETGEE